MTNFNPKFDRTELLSLTMSAFIVKHGLTMTHSRIEKRSDIYRHMTKDEEEWSASASHWQVSIYRQSVSEPYTCEYSQGAAHRVWKKDARQHVLRAGSHYIESERNDVHDLQPVQWKYISGKTLHLRDMVRDLTMPTPPNLEAVLDSLVLDAETWLTARDFVSWCAELGLNSDSRKAEAVYRACGEIAKGLQFLLGEVAFNELRRNVERL